MKKYDNKRQAGANAIRNLADGFKQHTDTKQEQIEQYLEENGVSEEEIEAKGLRKDILYKQIKKQAEQDIRGQQLADSLDKKRTRKQRQAERPSFDSTQELNDYRNQQKKQQDNGQDFMGNQL